MTKRQRLGIIFILGALSTLGPFSIDMYLPGFAKVALDLRTSLAAVGYSLTSYFIGISVGQLFYGPLIDRYGRKWPLLAGLLLYVLAAAACALSPSIAWLVGARLVMALGACVGLVVGRAIVRDLFPVSETASIFSTLMLVIAVSPALAPSVGGLLSDTLGWRFIFVVLALVSVGLFLIVLLRLPESKGPDPTASLRPKGIALQYLTVARNPQFLIYAPASGLASGGLFAYIAGAPTVFLDLYGLSQEQFAIVFALNASGLILGSQVNRLLLKRYASARITEVCVALEILLGVLLGLSFILRISSLPLVIALLFSFLFCQGIVNPNATAIALEPFSTGIGTASALLGGVQMVMAAIVTGVVSILTNGTAIPMAATMLGSAGMSYLLIAGFRRRSALRTLVSG